MSQVTMHFHLGDEKTAKKGAGMVKRGDVHSNAGTVKPTESTPPSPSITPPGYAGGTSNFVVSDQPDTDRVGPTVPEQPGAVVTPEQALLSRMAPTNLSDAWAQSGAKYLLGGRDALAIPPTGLTHVVTHNTPVGPVTVQSSPEVKVVAQQAGVDPGHANLFMNPHYYNDSDWVSHVANMPWRAVQQLWNMQHYQAPNQLIGNQLLMQHQQHIGSLEQNLAKAQASKNKEDINEAQAQLDAARKQMIMHELLMSIQGTGGMYAASMLGQLGQ